MRAKNLPTWLAVLALTLAFGLSSGCSKKVDQTPPTDSEIRAVADKLPEGPAVLAALDQKDYEGAVAALAKVQQSLPETELQPEFAALKQHVKNILMDASATDPKAESALNNLRMITQGR